MGLFKNLFGRGRPRQPEELVVPKVRFLGEHDGEPERAFKSAILPILAASGCVIRAYLAKVTYGDQNADINIALCLRSETQDSSVKRQVGEVFTKMFRMEEHLDAIMVTEQQEEMLASVCRPFFAR